MCNKCTSRFGPYQVHKLVFSSNLSNFKSLSKCDCHFLSKIHTQLLSISEIIRLYPYSSIAALRINMVHLLIRNVCQVWSKHIQQLDLFHAHKVFLIFGDIWHLNPRLHCTTHLFSQCHHRPNVRIINTENVFTSAILYSLKFPSEDQSIPSQNNATTLNKLTIRREWRTHFKVHKKWFLNLKKTRAHKTFCDRWKQHYIVAINSWYGLTRITSTSDILTNVWWWFA